MRDIFGNPALFDPYAVRGKAPLGCISCPMNNVPGVSKVINIERVSGCRGMMWAQSPGKVENAEQLELVGPSGKYVWKHLKRYGIERHDVDIQNVMRCYPIDARGEEHTPTTKEVTCCSIYNDRAIDANRGEAVVHIVFGDVAGAQMRKQFKIGAGNVVWHEPWNAYVIFTFHPSFVLRSGGDKAGRPFYMFRESIRLFASTMKNPGRWGYLATQNYGAVHDPHEMDQLEDYILYEASQGRRVSLDIEDGTVDNEHRVLVVGFGWGEFKGTEWTKWKGGARSVVLHHPEADQSQARINYMYAALKRIIENNAVKKVLQHGSYDDIGMQEDMGITMRGYNADSQYMAYLRHPTLRTYSIKALVSNFFLEFQDYKDTIVAEWNGNFANAPLDRLVTYNCADCDVTKRTEERFKYVVSQALLEVYIHAAYTLDDMEERGPYLDTEIWNAIHPVLLDKIAKSQRSLLRIAEDAGYPDYEPGAPHRDAKLLFDHLKMPKLAGRSTKKDVMELIGLQTGSPVPKMILDHRVLTHMESHNMLGYMKSAEKNDGILKTIWWLCGAATGRLRSGKSDQAEAEGLVNFQNIPNIPLIQMMITSDPNWRRVLDTE